MMKISDEIVLRHLLGAIASEYRSKHDMDQVCRILKRQEFAMRLSEVVDNLNFSLSGPLPNKPLDYDMERTSSEPLVESAYEAIQNQKLTKRAVVELMQQIAPTYPAEKTIKSSIRSIIYDFLRTTSSDEAHQFLNELRAIPEEDPYLTGILSHRKK